MDKGFWDIPNFYKELSSEHRLDASEWHNCPVCNQKPRVWIFDNGEFAKCRCNEHYDQGIRGKSIWDYHREHDGDMTNWNHDDLRDNWNAHVKNLVNV